MSTRLRLWTSFRREMAGTHCWIGSEPERDLNASIEDYGSLGIVSILRFRAASIHRKTTYSGQVRKWL